MRTVNPDAAKTNLSRLVEEAAAGEENIIAKSGKPMARLVSFVPAPTKRNRVAVICGPDLAAREGLVRVLVRCSMPAARTELRQYQTQRRLAHGHCAASAKH